MITKRNLKWSLILFYTWKDLLYYISLAVVVYCLYHFAGMQYLSIPSYAITAFGTALAIFLGFKNNNAYDRWWEARRLWGTLVNESRGWARQLINFIILSDLSDHKQARDLQKRMIYRHIAYVNALRVFLRRKLSHNENKTNELYESENEYHDAKPFLNHREYLVFRKKKNPPNYLLELQAEDLKRAFVKGWLSDFRFTKMEETLSSFTDVQGACERIKNTPLLRNYSFFSRVFVFIHATMLPFAFVGDMGANMIPISVVISFIFHSLDQVGERTEDPFENRMEDVPLTNLCISIETVLKEQWGDKNFPAMGNKDEGIVF